MNSKQRSEEDATGLNRREFLRLGSTVAAASALAGAACGVPQETTVPFNDMPEKLVDGLGLPRLYRTVLDGTPVLVKTREGRPILVTPSPNDASGRDLTLRHHAALMDLYDPDRARGPRSVRRSTGPLVDSNWNAIGTDVVAALKSAGRGAVLLTAPVSSPAIASVIAALTTATGMRHIVWAPIANDAAAEAWDRAFGTAGSGRARLDKADLVVGLGAEFLDRAGDGLERDFAARRSPDSDGAPMNRFVQLEGRLTLTGANADKRIRVRDSHLPSIAAALAHELIVVRKVGPLAANAAVADALSPFSIDAVSRKSAIEASVLAGIADELARAHGRALVVAGGSSSTSTSGAALELAVILLNTTVGAFDAGLIETAVGTVEPRGSAAALEALSGEMAAGRVPILIVAGVNPVYDAPPALKFADALAKVRYVVSLNDRVDETSRLVDALAPASHPFECWADARLPRGLLTVQQPVIQPLFDTRGLLDILVDWAAALGDPQALAAVQAATNVTTPPVNTAQPAPVTSVGWHYLRAAWKARLALDGDGFERAWTELLRDGTYAAGSERVGSAEARRSDTPQPAFSAAALELLSTAAAADTGSAIELQLYPHLALADGRAGNNAWLHELPDPITRITWGGALSIAPRRFDEMRLTNGDLVEIDAGHAKLVAPAYRHAGMHHDVVALPLGLGRAACGPIGDEVGPNGFRLRRWDNGRVVAAALQVTLRRIDGHEPLAIVQGANVIDREARPLLPVTTLTAYERDPASGTDQEEGGPSAWPLHDYPNARWAMAIDLSRCNGCGKCVIACQAENNVPVSGRQGILNGRPMSWIRIDRYYDAPKKDGGWDDTVWNDPLAVVEEPQTLFEPMLCQHCENAPCETVCPFNATMHSEDGLNEQVYNRCVGTRYCANNCPFKVRRFNYWEYSFRQESTFFRWLMPRIVRNAELNTRAPMQMKNNPEVTVRSRGVMEKCSFCVQRIRLARAQATRDGRPKDRLPDGAVVPACMEACPAGAIVFGDLNLPGSRVAGLASHPRAMRLLDALGVKPSISYLTRVRNDKA